MSHWKKNRPLVVVGVMLCICGAVISGALLKEHAGPWPSLEPAKGEHSLFSRLCGEGANGESGCAAVLKSNWSAVEFDVPILTRGLSISRSRVVVPVAFIGLAYFVFLGVWYAFAGPPQSWGRWRFVPFIVVLGGACGSFALLWVIIFKLESRCTWCIITHVINGLLMLGTLAIWPRRHELSDEIVSGGQRGDRGRYAQITLTPQGAFRITGFAVLVIMGLWMYRGAKLDTRQQVAKLLPYKKFVNQRMDDPAFLVREFLAEPELEVPLPTSGHGDESTRDVPTVTIFTDFQCSYCACFAHNWITEYRPRWTGPLRVSLRHLPLNQACNETVTSDLHPQACEASYAAEAARLQGGAEAFWKMHDALFTSSRRLGSRPYEKLATRIGLDGEQLLADMECEAVKQKIARDVALAAELGVRGTPSVFLNRRRVPEFCLYNPVFWEAVSAELQQNVRVAALPIQKATPEALEGGGAIGTTGQINP